MTATPERDTEPDGLRRRLYRPGATEADLRRYLDERAAATTADEPALLAPRRRPRRRAVLGAAAGVVMFAALITAVATQERTAHPAARAVVSLNVGTGRLLTADPGKDTDPTRTEISIDGAAATTERFEGVGDEVVPVRLPSAPRTSRTAVVALYSARTSTITWRAMRLAPRMNGFIADQVVAEGRITSLVDLADPARFSYAGDPPTRIVVEAPPGLGWTLIVATPRS